MEASAKDRRQGRLLVKKIASFGIADFLSKMTTTPNKLAERVKQILGS